MTTKKAAKAPRPVAHRYAANLVHSWLTHGVPENGAHYHGSSARLEADPIHLYCGHRSVLLAVHNRALNTVIATSCDGSPFSGSASDALRQVLSCQFVTHTTRFVPQSERSGRWSATETINMPPLMDELIVVMVDQLRESHATCDLATLIPGAQARIDRVIKQEVRRRDEANYWPFQGFWSSQPSQGSHDDYKVTAVPQSNFERLGIPWKAEWDTALAVHAAKRKLAQV